MKDLDQAKASDSVQEAKSLKEENNNYQLQLSQMLAILYHCIHNIIIYDVRVHSTLLHSPIISVCVCVRFAVISIMYSYYQYNYCE